MLYQNCCKYEAKNCLNTQSIITGGDYDPDTKLLALTGTLYSMNIIF